MCLESKRYSGEVLQAEEVLVTQMQVVSGARVWALGKWRHLGWRECWGPREEVTGQVTEGA